MILMIQQFNDGLAMKILSFIDNLFDRLSIVGGAFIGSQIPPLMNQYAHRLAGHVDALQKQLAQLEAIAVLSNKTLEQYIQKFKESPDGDFFSQGTFIEGISLQYHLLSEALDNLTQSSIWMRPYFFLKDLQPDIVHSTLSSFIPGLNFTLEGICYALCGMVAGWAAYQILSRGCAWIILYLSTSRRSIRGGFGSLTPFGILPPL